MVLKKKHTASEDIDSSLPISLEDDVVKEERKVPVTQIVEVIEDDVASEVATESMKMNTISSKSGGSEVGYSDQTLEHQMDSTPVEVEQEESESSDEKRKELVDELFQKRIDTPARVTPEISMHKSEKSKPIYIWAIGVITTCLVIGGSLLFFSKNGVKLPSISAVPTPTATPSKSVSPTPTSLPLKKDSITIQVLNGGGKAGAATKMKLLLEEKGYTVKDTANADAYTYETTEIHVKPAKKDYLSTLEEDLKGAYTIGKGDAVLEETVLFDVQVIVGKE